jgi:hypothetical protein
VQKFIKTSLKYLYIYGHLLLTVVIVVVESDSAAEVKSVGTDAGGEAGAQGTQLHANTAADISATDKKIQVLSQMTCLRIYLKTH